MSEKWLPVVGFEETYEVSDRGRVRSLDRIVINHNPDRTYFRAGQILKARNDKRGYPKLSLWRDGNRTLAGVHRLVAEAFIGPLPDGLHTRHLNGDPGDNRLENLAYGTASENQLDRVRHGRHNHAQKTHCKWNHPFDEANTEVGRRAGWRVCRACRKRRSQEQIRRRRAA